jgi:HAD superfamily hydrolase (TIGR01484 family)
MLALDVDGTLLDASGELRPGVAGAVDRAVGRGIRAIICTGRRYRRAATVARLVGLGVPMVCNSGALVKDPASHQTLWRADLPPECVARVLDQFDEAGYPAVSFTDREPGGRDFLVAVYPTGRPPFDDYVGQNRDHAEIDPAWPGDARAGRTRHFHVCAIGTRNGMIETEASLHRAVSSGIRTFVQRSPRYSGWMCEVIRADAGKWSAVCHVAEMWGIPLSQICAVGDDLNDRPMIEHAGLGVAMGHAPESVRAVADVVLTDAFPDDLASFLDTLAPA